MIKFDVILVEKPGNEGMNHAEIKALANAVEEYGIETEYYPIDIETDNNVAMGFISVDAAVILGYDYTASGFVSFISNILGDMDNESPNHVYKLEDKYIFLSRNLEDILAAAKGVE